MMFERNRKLTILKLIAFVLVMLLFSAAGFSQHKPNKSKSPGKDKKVKVLSSDAPSEPNESNEPAEPSETSESPMPPEEGERVQNDDDTPAEKSIKVESTVVVYLSVSEGDVRINGWNRDEVRAYVSGGSQVGFKVLRKGKESGKPTSIKVMGYDPDEMPDARPEESVSGEKVEIDVPYNAIISLKSGRGDSRITIHAVEKATVESVSGDVTVTNVKNGVTATTWQGDLVVQDSGGPISLSTTDGNIIVANVEPNEIDDAFKAKTQSGSMSLKSLGHMQVSTNSISGLQKFDSAILNGAQYYFNSSNGPIYLLVPKDASCRLSALFGPGGFKSDLMLKDVVKTPTPQGGQKLTGLIGAGDASLNFSTVNGLVRISVKP